MTCSSLVSRAAAQTTVYCAVRYAYFDEESKALFNTTALASDLTISCSAGSSFVSVVVATSPSILSTNADLSFIVNAKLEGYQREYWMDFNYLNAGLAGSPLKFIVPAGLLSSLSTSCGCVRTSLYCFQRRVRVPFEVKVVLRAATIQSFRIVSLHAGVAFC